MFPFKKKKTSTNFTPTPKFVGPLTQRKSFRFEKGRFFSTSPTPNSSPHHQLTSPKKPSDVGRPFLEPNLSGAPHRSQPIGPLGLGGGDTEVHIGPSRRGQKKGWNNLGGDGATRFQVFLWYSTCQMWRVEIILSFWMSKSILSF